MSSIASFMLCICWLVKSRFIYGNRVYAQQQSDDKNNKIELNRNNKAFFYIWGSQIQFSELLQETFDLLAWHIKQKHVKMQYSN